MGVPVGYLWGYLCDRCLVGFCLKIWPNWWWVGWWELGALPARVLISGFCAPCAAMSVELTVELSSPRPPDPTSDVHSAPLFKSKL